MRVNELFATSEIWVSDRVSVSVSVRREDVWPLATPRSDVDIMQSDQTGGSGIGGTIESFPRSPGSTRAHVLYTWAGRVVHVAWLNTTLCVDSVGLNYK